MPDETSEKADLILPDNTPLESWGDAAPREGVRSLVQPTIRPLYDTQSLGDALLQTARAMGDDVAAALPDGQLPQRRRGRVVRHGLARGPGPRRRVRVRRPRRPSASPRAWRGSSSSEPELEGGGSFTLLAHPSPLLSDGSGANLGWLQETPDPVTSVAWQSWAEISRTSAERLGVDTGDVLAIATPVRNHRGSRLSPRRHSRRRDRRGHRSGPHGRALRVHGERRPPGRGARRQRHLAAARPHRRDGRPRLAHDPGRREAAAGRHQRLPLTQFTDNKRGRQLGDAISLAALSAKADGGSGALCGRRRARRRTTVAGGHAESHEIRRPYDAAEGRRPRQFPTAGA